MIQPKLNTKLILKLAITFILFITSNSQLPKLKINETIDPPRYNVYKIPTDVYVSQSNKLISLTFPQINYEISSQMYMNLSTMNDAALFDKNAYRGDVGKYCQLYPTNIQTRVRSTIKYPENVTTLAYTMNRNQKKSRFYVLGSDSVLYKYIFDEISVKLSEQYPLEKEITKIKDGQLTVNIQMIEVGGRLLFFTDSAVYYFDSKNIVNSLTLVPGFKPVERFVDIGIFKNGSNENEINGFHLWICSNKDVQTYQMVNTNGQLTMKVVSTVYHFTNDTIAAVLFEPKYSTFYLTAGNDFMIIATQQFMELPNSGTYELDSKCTGITKVKEAIYLVCQYEKINYVMEIRGDKPRELKLNRYYDDSFLEGIRDVEPLGYDKVALIGDEQAIVIGQAINRIPLLELADKGIIQTKYLLYSFGMIDFYYIPDYSTPQISTVLLFSQTALTMLAISYVPPQVQCKFPRDEVGTTVSLLFAFNTSHCPYSVREPSTLGGNLIQCQTLYPYQIALGQREYEEKTARFAFFIIMLIIIVLILLCAGLGVQIRNKANALITSIQNKIEKIKNERDNSGIKKI